MARIERPPGCSLMRLSFMNMVTALIWVAMVVPTPAAG
jgi:hypothetical protein